MGFSRTLEAHGLDLDTRRRGVRARFVRAAAATAAAVATAALVGTSGAAASPATSVSRAPVAAFQAAGDVGGGVLEPGATFSPTTHRSATLKRGSDWIQVNIETSGLPAGAYTVWWIVFNNPEECNDGCSEEDLFNDAVQGSVFWATGGVVHQGGTGSFTDRHRVGDDLGEPGSQHLLGDGAIDPTRAEIHNVIKYHGPASEDSATLYDQTHTVWGSCSEGANAVDLGEPLGIQCFDPQAVAHPLP